MSQLISGSPEGDDLLPSFMERRPKSSAQSPQPTRQALAGPSQSTPERRDTQSPRPKPPTHSQPHAHAHAHAHCNSANHHHSHANQRQSTVRTWSLASSSSLGVPASAHDRPPSRSMSRTPSHEYRETLDAKSRDLDDGSRIINQYKITDLIGRGAYGTVRKAILTDDPSVLFAVKEFGKTRLRKTHRAVNFRKPGRARHPRSRPQLGRDDVPNSSDPERSDDSLARNEQDELKDPLTHIRHEIAILKKLHHPNVVKLYEVLDDPSKDGLYMVFEYCPDGTVIDVKLNQSVEPLPEDVARLYFVQILMGIEYLHENEIVHRDIKPDNILLSDNRKTCKIVDFGVSEMFLKPGDDTMQKSAGSPAFMSPELCTAGHQEYHGKSDDIWSFGVTLYCMVVGRLPFDKDNFYELYESIKTQEPEYPHHLSPDLKDLLKKMLTKHPEKRITVDEMRGHAWTLGVEEGILLSKHDNIQTVVSEITDEDLDCAICKITNIFTFARAISRFKKGGSMQRARREASRSTSGGSNHDGSWFPPSTPSPDKPSRSNTKDSTSGDANVESSVKSVGGDVATIKEETSTTPAAQHEHANDGGKLEQPASDHKQDAEDVVQGLQDAAAYMFESPQMHTFELAREEPDGNGPLQRNRSGPITTLHKPEAKQTEAEETDNGAPVITMDSPRSASPEIFGSPTSESAPDLVSNDSASSDVHRSHGSSSVNTSSRSYATEACTDYTADTCKPDDAMAAQLSEMMLEHGNAHAKADGAEAQDKVDGGAMVPLRTHTVQQHAALLGKRKPKRKRKRKPKLLRDQPTFGSPLTQTIPTPPGAAEAYMQSGCAGKRNSADGEQNQPDGEHACLGSSDESQHRSKEKDDVDAERQAATV